MQKQLLHALLVEYVPIFLEFGRDDLCDMLTFRVRRTRIHSLARLGGVPSRADKGLHGSVSDVRGDIVEFLEDHGDPQVGMWVRGDGFRFGRGSQRGMVLVDFVTTKARARRKSFVILSTRVRTQGYRAGHRCQHTHNHGEQHRKS